MELRTGLAALLALLISVFSAAFNLGLSIRDHEETLRTGIIFAPDHGGRDIYLELAVLHLGISVVLLIFLFVLRFGRELWTRAVSMSLLMLVLVQSVLLMGVKPASLPLSVTNYSHSLQVIWYFDFVLVLFSILTALMYGYLSWKVVKSNFEAK